MLAVQPAEEPRLFAVPEGAEALGRPRRGGARRRRRPSPVLLAVDGNGLAHRAFHAAGEAGDAHGRLLSMLARVGERTRPTACVLGFDDPVMSLRRDRYDGYKATRPPKDAELVKLLADLPELLGLLGFSVVTPAGLEADDVLGSVAGLGRRRGVATVLVTGDQDAFALVSTTVRVWLLQSGGRLEQVSPSWLRSRYGVGPERYQALAALRGDSSDCLPGVRGIGAVTAARLLAEFGDVAAAVADPVAVARLLGPGVAEALVTQQDVYRRNRELMAIRDDLPLDVDAANRRLDAATVHDVLADRGLQDLAGRLLGGFALLGRAAWRRFAT